MTDLWVVTVRFVDSRAPFLVRFGRQDSAFASRSDVYTVAARFAEDVCRNGLWVDTSELVAPGRIDSVAIDESDIDDDRDIDIERQVSFIGNALGANGA